MRTVLELTRCIRVVKCVLFGVFDFDPRLLVDWLFLIWRRGSRVGLVIAFLLFLRLAGSHYQQILITVDYPVHQNSSATFFLASCNINTINKSHSKSDGQVEGLLKFYIFIEALNCFGYLKALLQSHMHKAIDKQPSSQKTNLKDLKDRILNNNTDVDLSLSDTPMPSHHSQQIHNPQSLLARREHPQININKPHTNQHIANKDSSKKLKLKDYLHLNSIERKNKNTSRSHTKNSQIEASKAESMPPILENSSILMKNTIHQQRQATCQVLKNQAISHIEQEIKRLKDLESYIKQEYSPKKDDKETELFLFGLCKSLEKTGDIHKKMGQSILEYDATGRNTNRKYFWNEKNRELESPARMNVLKLSYLTYASFLEDSKAKDHKS